jgi:hypothetical protein
VPQNIISILEKSILRDFKRGILKKCGSDIGGGGQIRTGA